jgi:predicted  nucleic acid-binding Zn-ribbon protein
MYLKPGQQAKKAKDFGLRTEEMEQRTGKHAPIGQSAELKPLPGSLIYYFRTGDAQLKRSNGGYMKIPDDLRKFNDPLFPKGKKVEKPAAETTPSRARTSPGKARLSTILPLVALLIGLGALGYYIFESRNQIDLLQQTLTVSQSRLQEVSQDLDSSRQTIGELQQGLSKSQSQLQTQNRQLGQHRNLYQNLKSEQEYQEKELETLFVRKADRSQVKDVERRVGETDAQVAELHDASTAARRDIEETRGAVAAVREAGEANTREIAGVKRNLEREVYNFELAERGTIIKLFDIAIALKNADAKGQKCSLEIVAGGKRIKRDNHNVNVPVYFYMEGTDKPYELVITRVNPKTAVGYLSIPVSS